MSQTVLRCRWRGRIALVGFKLEPSIAWTRVHAISHQRTCAILCLSEMLDGRHVASLGASDRHRSEIRGSSGMDYNLMVRSSSHRGQLGIARSSSDGRDRSWSWRRAWSYHDHKISIERRRKLMEELHDHGAIEPRSWLLQRGIRATILPLDRTAIDWWPGSRSTHDRGPIVAWSWSLWSKNWGEFTANPGATTSPEGIASTTPQNRFHDCIKWPQNRA